VNAGPPERSRQAMRVADETHRGYQVPRKSPNKQLVQPMSLSLFLSAHQMPPTAQEDLLERIDCSAHL